MVQLHRASSRLEDAGGRLVIIGNGTPSFIEGFREKSGFQGPVYTDPSRRTYEALRLRRDIGSSLNLRSARRAFQAYRKGFRQSRTEGDAWQQGGVFVISGQGNIVFRYASEYAGDHPPVEPLVEALRQAAPDRA